MAMTHQSFGSPSKLGTIDDKSMSSFASESPDKTQDISIKRGSILKKRNSSKESGSPSKKSDTKSKKGFDLAIVSYFDFRMTL